MNDIPSYVYTPHLQGRKAIQSYYEKAAIKPNVEKNLKRKKDEEGKTVKVVGLHSS